MKIISTFIHGIGDYVGAFALLLAPNLFGFSDVGGAAVVVPRVLGVVMLLQAMITQYELGMFKLLPMKMHLMNDYIASLFLAASPWIFGFNDEKANAWMPHLVVGLALFVFTLMTDTVPSRSAGRTAAAR